MKKKKVNLISIIVGILIALCPVLYNFYDEIYNFVNKQEEKEVKTQSYDIGDIPEYNGNNYVVINNNNPRFDENDYDKESFQEFGNLDNLKRCTSAYAKLDKSMMPTEKRGSIGMIKPSGWHTVKYDIVDGKYLYNRCHLIGYQLSGENANELNLITCTRSTNTKRMLEFENKVAEYIKKTGNHVLYRVTPIFENDNLLASGIQMEAYSIEDNGHGIKFNVYVYNVEDGIEIDYKTGDSHLISNEL